MSRIVSSTVLRLSAPQIAEASAVIAQEFFPMELSALTLHRLGRRMDLYQIGPVHENHVLTLILRAHDEGWLAQLLSAALQAKPRSERLAELMSLLGGGPRLEAALSGAPLLPVALITRLFRWICRIGTDRHLGTGFLIAPDLVLTNFHVVEQIGLTGGISAARATFEPLDEWSGGGNSYEIGFLPTWRPPGRSPANDEGMPDQVQPTANQLDYAVLRLSERVGLRPLNSGEATSPPRGWLFLGDRNLVDNTLPVTGAILTVCGHPSELAASTPPLRISQGTVTDCPFSERVRYATSSLNGSSGSPCFNSAWQLVALHHAADANRINPRFNQGIPIGLIITDLRSRAEDFNTQNCPSPLDIPPGGEADQIPTTPPPPVTPATTATPTTPATRARDAVLLGHPPRIAFANRSVLRSHLDTLSTGSSDHRLVTVSGPAGCGKTHSRLLIEHVADDAGIRRAYLDISMPQDIADACRFLVDQMGFSLEVQDQLEERVLCDDADPGRLGLKFGNWLARTTAAAGERWWLLIDGLDPEENPVPDLLDHLVGGLMQAARNSNRFTKMILFLLGSGRPDDSHLRSYALDDPLERLNGTELRIFFERYAALRGIALRPDELDLAVTRSVGQVNGPLSIEQMRSLQDGVNRVISALAS